MPLPPFHSMLNLPEPQSSCRKKSPRHLLREKLPPAFLVNDAGSSLYSKTMRRISTQANLLGQKIPEGYASDAAATEKRRVKQDAFIKAKEEERIAAEAEAAEAAAEAEPEETSEETKAVEEAVEEPEPVVA